jgi:hypothetical protein
MGALDLGPDERKMMRFSSRESYDTIRNKIANILDRNASRLNLRYRIEQNGSKKNYPTQLSDEDFEIYLEVIRPHFTAPRNANGKKSARGPPKGAIVVFLVNPGQNASGDQENGSGKGGQGKKGKQVRAFPPQSSKLLTISRSQRSFSRRTKA